MNSQTEIGAHQSAPTPDRCFLFLQPHPSGFGRAILREMDRRNITYRIINVSLGDFIYRFGFKATNYIGKVRNWRTYLEAFIDEHGITDIVYYSDQRPYHRIARAVAYQRGLRAFAYEFGYFRPDWITLERSGMGVFSHFPEDPALIRRLAEDLEANDPEGFYPHTFFAEAFNEVVYNFIPVFFPYLFHHYRRDRLYHPIRDYPSYVPRLLRSGKKNREASRTIEALTKSDAQYFVVPMQMQGDYQVRRCSHYPHLREMIEEVIGSFAENAAKDIKLVFKIHPLDNNIEDWAGIIERTAYHHNCSERVTTIDGGNLNRLLGSCAGVILVNSTTGITALQAGIPVKVLGIAIYDIAGLSHQGSLDTFWTDPEKPDKTLMEAFSKLMKASIQIKGNFFNPEGKEVGARHFVDRLIEDKVNGHGAFVEPPPRVAKAKRMGVPMTYEI
ncbi:MAG: capsular biosynthesis protein [Pseudomonadota bacterium]